MSDISPQELASEIVRDAVQRYIESRARGSTRLSNAISPWPAPLRCIGERSAGIC
jgi:hypothetical protein